MSELSDEERVSLLVEGIWFYEPIVIDGKITMDISDARFLCKLAQEAIIERQNK